MQDRRPWGGIRDERPVVPAGASPSRAPPAAVPGRGEAVIRRVDRYDLVEQVGTGGMAAVYRGRDTALDREVAVKVLHPHLASRPESRARFSREARAVARLAHPNIVEIYDCAGDDAPESWLVTEFVRGRTLRAYADEEGFGYPEIGALVGRAVAQALAHAHAAGVIHRDLKPENVLICEEPGRRAVKLADFGIARILASDERMTMTGALVGSPNHMAPEIIEGREADARSDLFSLGTLLYWLVAGRLPFAAPNPTATLKRVVEGDFDDPRRSSPLLSDALASAVAQLMAGDPSRRPASAALACQALDAALAESGIADPEEELRAFLEDPPGYKRAFGPRLAATLVRRGEEALGQGASARALSLFNRVLALEPRNARVLGHLASLAARARWRRRLRAAAAALSVAAVLATALAVARAVRTGPRLALALRAPAAPPSPADPSSPPPAVAGISPAAPAPRPEPSGNAPRPSPRGTAPSREASAGRPAPAPTVAPLPAAVSLLVHVRPYAQRVLLDDTEVARGQQIVTLSLAPGRHRIRVEHPCCNPYVRDIDAAEAARLGEIRIPLLARPARLRVEGDPATRVYAGNLLLGTAGESQRSPLPLAVPPGGDSPYEGQVELRLEREGEDPVLAPVKIRAGGEVTVAVPAKEGPP